MQIVLRFYAQLANQKKDFVKREIQLQLACNATKYRFQPLNLSIYTVFKGYMVYGLAIFDHKPQSAINYFYRY